MTDSLYDNDYGFTWGPIRVRRIAAMKRGKGLYRILHVDAGLDENYSGLIELCISPTGRNIRVFKDGRELR